MITKNEIDELFDKAKEDGERLYKMSELVYKILIVFVCLIGIVGTILSLVAFSERGGLGFIVLLSTAILCAIGYISAVLSTHISKVLVHLLFSNLVIISKGEEKL